MKYSSTAASAARTARASPRSRSSSASRDIESRIPASRCRTRRSSASSSGKGCSRAGPSRNPVRNWRSHLESAQGPLLARAGAVGARKAPMRLVLTGRNVDIPRRFVALVDASSLARTADRRHTISAQIMLTARSTARGRGLAARARHPHAELPSAGAHVEQRLGPRRWKRSRAGQERERQVGRPQAAARGGPDAPAGRVPRRRARTSRASSGARAHRQADGARERDAGAAARGTSS